MKHVTTIEQSRLLAEILPLDSADFYWVNENRKFKLCRDYMFFADGDIPAWSLGALLDVIPYCSLRRFVDGNWVVAAEFSCKGYRESLPNKSAVDACYELIIRLHEQKLI